MTFRSWKREAGERNGSKYVGRGWKRGRREGNSRKDCNGLTDR